MALTPNIPNNDADKRADRDAKQQEVLLREVDDALRQDQLATFGRKYGKQLAGVVIGGLALFGGWLLWTEFSDGNHEEVSEELVKSLDQLDAGNFDTAAKQLEKLEKDGGDGAAAIARLLRASVAQRDNKNVEAARLYGEIANDSDVPEPYRNLALIRQVSINYAKMKPADVVEKLKPLAKPGTPYFGSAGELVGAAYLDMGKTDLAGPLFGQIAKDEDVPDSLRSRARQLAGMMGVDAIEDVDETLKDLRNEGEEPAAAQ
ncbi:tetratricopeptide repeat protein [Altererythrobacter sp. CC-YST694]|uniref:tetratricopeptide repeat protein n=1 Tax=Altererythrobacter sp. CC-YST694 TaxID=2755038 RepID=UPI001D035451|nr:tetratricopeptide repeat protein [Altererythrobacter sp. CC-YST694]MCB5424032.1 tetratricopeptide repeat protein [Altererythrobacter sp. CC-YST694]